MFLRILSIVAPILLIVLVGWLYGRYRKIDLTDLNRLNVELLSPLLVLAVWLERDVSLAAYAPLLTATTLVVLGTGAIAWGVAQLAGYPWRAFVPAMMFTNTGNIGLPLMLLAFGAAAFPGVVAIFVLVTLLHFTLGVRLLNPGASLSMLLRVPMVWALLLALVVQLSGWHPPASLLLPAKMLGETAIPLSLFALGVRLADFAGVRWRVGAVGALLCPLVSLLLAWPLALLFGLDAGQRGVLLVFAALPPAVLNYLFAEQYRQHPDLVAAIVVAGTLAALVFIPAALYVAL
ncbi:AEC family transporter [Chitinolyticbacter meiyuanensis]|uniref:AEC family transporter n=1 Tax=Chitinolyticbacter meiyuanensis TaxID=682798 RepID=UPI0011E59CAC|nr:AEC family transporter [Chitinolyticbacter meiyuanensis]